MTVLAIHDGHDAGACLIRDGKELWVSSEERRVNSKNFSGVPVRSIDAVLKKAGVIGKQEGVEVSMEKVQRRSITETVTASGKIYPETEVKMSSDVSGEIVELNVEEGDSVHKGQQLAKIYADIYGNQVNQAAAQVNQQEALVSQYTAQLPGLKATMAQRMTMSRNTIPDAHASVHVDCSALLTVRDRLNDEVGADGSPITPFVLTQARVRAAP